MNSFSLAQALFTTFGTHWHKCRSLFGVLIWRYNDLALADTHYERARQFLDHLHTISDPKTHVVHADWGGGLLGDWCAALGVNDTGDGSTFSARHVSGIFNVSCAHIPFHISA